MGWKRVSASALPEGKTGALRRIYLIVVDERGCSLAAWKK